MQVQCCSFWSKVILPNRSHPVDPHSSVDVFDTILNGAHVGVGQSMAISEVQRNARPCTVTLHRKKKKKNTLEESVHTFQWGFNSAGAVFRMFKMVFRSAQFDQFWVFSWLSRTKWDTCYSSHQMQLQSMFCIWFEIMSLCNIYFTGIRMCIYSE